MWMTLTMGVFLNGAAFGQIAPASPPADTAPAVAGLVPQQVASLLADLGNPQLAVRERATAALSTLDAGALDAIVALYQREPIYEKKLRLREAIERLFYQQYMKGEEGFIGIKLNAVPDVFDPATGRRMECVYVLDVLPGQPAEGAGLRAGDLVVGFDGKPVSWFFSTPAPGEKLQPPAGGWQGQMILADPKIDRFTRHVKRRTPGANVTLDLLRCDPRSRRVSLEVGADPRRTLEGATWTPVPETMLGSSTAIAGLQRRAGLMLTQIVGGSEAERLELKVGEVLVGLRPPAGSLPGPPVPNADPAQAVAGQLPVPVEAGSEWLSDMLARWQPGSRVALELARIEQIQVPLTLGRRPVRLMNEVDLVDARVRFLAWWRQISSEELPRKPEPSRFFSLSANRPPSWLPEAAILP